MSYISFLYITLTCLAILLVICILSQKSEGSAIQANAKFKARGAKSIMNNIIGVLFALFVVASLALSVQIKNSSSHSIIKK